MAGYVYVLLNPGMPGLVKIGRTDRHPSDRARELSKTGSAYPFIAAYWREVPDPVTAETWLHSYFHEHRVNRDREFFRIEVVEVIDAMQQLAAVDESPAESYRNDLPATEAPYLYWAKVQDGTPFVRIGISDIARTDLKAAIQTSMELAYPSTIIQIGEPKFFEIKNRYMGEEVIEQLRERQVKSMPSVYSSISESDLLKVVEGHESRAEKKRREQQASLARAIEMDSIAALAKRI